MPLRPSLDGIFPTGAGSSGHRQHPRGLLTNDYDFRTAMVPILPQGTQPDGAPARSGAGRCVTVELRNACDLPATIATLPNQTWHEVA
jgi:hypothetical protein